MTSTSALSATSAAATSSTTSDVSGLATLNQADFIKLLTAQLQNQDPTSPTKPQDLANEFAELSTVSGINSLNSQVQSITANAGAAEIGQAATLIGRTVAVSGAASAVGDASGTVTGGFRLDSAASNAKIRITDASTGQVVQTLSMRDLPAGMNQFSWSGGSAGHAYDYAVSASSGDAQVTATTYANAPVTAVNLSDGTPTLTLAGASQPVALSQIVSIVGG